MHLHAVDSVKVAPHGIDLDTAVISLDRLQAFASLLADEDVVERFGELDTHEQTALFGLVEELTISARSALDTPSVDTPSEDLAEA
jgi:hypothetical protein